jgi:hypothetical protein
VKAHPLKSEFLRLAKRSKWTQAEIARQLDLTRGGVHGIVKGDTVPSRALVRLFQFVLAEKAPAGGAAWTRGAGKASTRATRSGGGFYGSEELRAVPSPAGQGMYAGLLRELDKLPPKRRRDFVEHLTHLARLVTGKK